MHESDAGLSATQRPVLPLDSVCGFAVIGRAIRNVAASTRIFIEEALGANRPQSVRPSHREAIVAHDSQVYLFSQDTAVEVMITGNLPDPDQVSNLYGTAAGTGYYSTSDAQLAARLGLAVAAASPNQAAIDAALVAFADGMDNRSGLGWAPRPDSPAAIFIPGVGSAEPRMQH